MPYDDEFAFMLRMGSRIDAAEAVSHRECFVTREGLNKLGCWQALMDEQGDSNEDCPACVGKQETPVPLCSCLMAW